MPEHEMNEVNPYIIHCGLLHKHNCLPPGTVFEKRRVKWYEVELILWGEGYVITEGKKLNTRKGDLFFRHPGMVVQGCAPYYCYLIVFDSVYDKNNESYLDLNFLDADSPSDAYVTGKETQTGQRIFSFPDVFNTVQFIEFERLFSSAYNEFIYKKPESQFYLKTYLMQILLSMHNECSSSSRLQQAGRSIRLNYPKIMEVKKHIDVNIKSEFRLNELADLAKLSPNFFCRIFKDIVGDSPINYINKYRINNAKKLLIKTSMGIKEIAYECGFDNDTYFYTLFKRFEGQSPSAFREKHRTLFR